MLVSFEGGEASGKSVQAKRLADALRREGHDVLVTREPGGTPFGERVREIVLHAKEVPLSPRAQALLFTAARAQNVDDVIRPALRERKVVIADRFFDSTFVYQGLGEGVTRMGLEAITAFAVGDVRPERTFVLDVPLELAVSRRAAAERAWDRFEVAEREYHERVREAYLELARRDPVRVRVIDGSRDEDTIAREIRREMDAVLSGPA